MNRLVVREKVTEFLKEDLFTGDSTTESIFSGERESVGTLFAKDTGIFCGVTVIEEGLHLVDPDINIRFFIRDGQELTPGQKIMEARGKTRALLSSERVILNLIQRMSGIATATYQAIQTLNDSTIRICDTRKTAPGLRIFDKYAVRMGGGSNHRFGLYDAVMIKDNHIAAAGGIEAAVEKVRKEAGHMVKIEVEVTNEQEVAEAVEKEVDVIMLDNWNPGDIKELTERIPASIKTEASGNITLENIGEYRDSGVHYLSLGSITHSVKAFDMSFLLEPKKQRELRNVLSKEEQST